MMLKAVALRAPSPYRTVLFEEAETERIEKAEQKSIAGNRQRSILAIGSAWTVFDGGDRK